MISALNLAADNDERITNSKTLKALQQSPSVDGDDEDEIVRDNFILGPSGLDNSDVRVPCARFISLLPSLSI
jgi:hypothetical protein